jgi:CRP-like cAMP-binding protein
MAEEGKPLSHLDADSVLPIINKISIFAGLSEGQLFSLFQLLEKVTYTEGETIFEEGDKPSHIYVVRSGKVKLVVNRDDTALELIEFGQGDCFGEASVIGIQPHGATAVAVEDAELIVLSRDALLSLYKTDLELYSILILNIAREACRRLHKSDEILLRYVLKK